MYGAMSSTALSPAQASAPLRATLIGATALVMWSFLALLTTTTGGVPPFQLTAITFGIAGILGLGIAALQGKLIFILRQPPRAWFITIGGLFGYHFSYFLALKTSPPVAASLINYLWPLCIVLFSGLLPGEKLHWTQMLGALAGLAGTALAVLGGGGGFSFDPAHLPGYAAAFACALIWGAYSVASRRWCAGVPTDFMAVGCAGTALLATGCHFVSETTFVPEIPVWGIMLLMGLGPVGAAFYVWDIGVKRGHIRVLGACSYATPLFTTLLLILAGRGELTAAVAGAAALIIGGALLASRELWRRR